MDQRPLTRSAYSPVTLSRTIENLKPNLNRHACLQLLGSGVQYSLRFSEKGGKLREIPVRHDLEQFLLAYIQAAGITEGPLFRPAVPQDEDS